MDGNLKKRSFFFVKYILCKTVTLKNVIVVTFANSLALDQTKLLQTKILQTTIVGLSKDI